jgi:hypothetical protein
VSGRRPKPEDLAVARVSGIARRRSGTEPIDVEEALAEIRAVPVVSPAVLAEAAGLTLGHHHSSMDWGTRIVEAGLLIAAGTDVSRLRYWIREGAERKAIRPLEEEMRQAWDDYVEKRNAYLVAACFPKPA